MSARLDELQQMFSAPADGYSAGEWCEAGNELLAMLLAALPAVQPPPGETEHDGTEAPSGCVASESGPGNHPVTTVSDARSVSPGGADTAALIERLDEWATDLDKREPLMGGGTKRAALLREAAAALAALAERDREREDAFAEVEAAAARAVAALREIARQRRTRTAANAVDIARAVLAGSSDEAPK